MTMRCVRIASTSAGRAGTPCTTAPAVGPGVGVTVSHAARTAASPNIPSHERIGIEYPARRVPVPVTRRTTKRRVPVAALASMAR